MAPPFLLPPRQRFVTSLCVECFIFSFIATTHGDLIKEKAIFPNQQNCFKKLSELVLRCFDS